MQTRRTAPVVLLGGLQPNVMNFLTSGILPPSYPLSIQSLSLVFFFTNTLPPLAQFPSHPLHTPITHRHLLGPLPPLFPPPSFGPILQLHLPSDSIISSLLLPPSLSLRPVTTFTHPPLPESSHQSTLPHLDPPIACQLLSHSPFTSLCCLLLLHSFSPDEGI